MKLFSRGHHAPPTDACDNPERANVLASVAMVDQTLDVIERVTKKLSDLIDS